MSLRKRIANSRRLNRAVVRAFAGYLRLAHRTTRWKIEGAEALEAELNKNGAVIMVLWHQKVAYSPFLFPVGRFPVISITSNARAGRLAGAIQAEFGFETVAFGSKSANLSASRQVIRMIRDGHSIGIAADGPRGPARVLKTVPLEWARATGKPIILASFAVRRFWRWKTWDAMTFPWPFTTGLIRYRVWEADLPRRWDAAMLEDLRIRLEADLTAHTRETDDRLLISQ